MHSLPTHISPWSHRDSSQASPSDGADTQLPAGQNRLPHWLCPVHGSPFGPEGSVRLEGERIRITAQLIDGSTGHHVWAEGYDLD